VPAGVQRSTGQGSFLEPRPARIRFLRSIRGANAAIQRALFLRRRPAKPSVDRGLVLYRDTNGWCPFCERVWLALELMGVDYSVRTVNLQTKDKGFLRLADAFSPTGRSSVPVVTTPDGGYVVWESMDILHWLSGKTSNDWPGVSGTSESVFAGTDTARFLSDGTLVQVAKDKGPTRRIPALDMGSGGSKVTPLPKATEGQLVYISGVMSAMGKVTAAFGGGPETEEEKTEAVAKAVQALNALEAAFDEDKGPFLGGDKPSAADCAVAPFLGRYPRDPTVRATKELSALAEREAGTRWPRIAGWYSAMGKLPAFAATVEADNFSAAKLRGTFAAYALEWSRKAEAGEKLEGPYAKKRSPEEVAALEARVADSKEACAAALPSPDEARAFLASVEFTGMPSARSARVLARREAAANLAAAGPAVAADAIKGIAADSAEEDAGAPSTAEAEALVRLIATALLSSAPGTPTATLEQSESLLASDLGADALDAAACKRIAAVADHIASRLCCPRDMGAPAGAHVRAACVVAAAVLTAA